MEYKYIGDCTQGNYDDLHDMLDNAKEITRKTFIKHVGRKKIWEIEKDLGYFKNSKKGLTMAKDWHVSYHVSHYQGKKCYYFRWSSIEHIFA